jgi:hypothetical protein
LDGWNLLSHNFKDNPEIVVAIDEWAPKQKKVLEPEIAFASLVGRTTVAKMKLLSLLSSSIIPHWSAGALIEGWGMEDSEVSEKLTQIAFGPAGEASEIGHLLPEIIKDKAKCRRRLIELLRDSECKRPDFVMLGLVSLGNTQGDTEAVDAVLNLSMNRLNYRYLGIIERLIINYSSDQRVRKLAMQELLERDGIYAAVAWAYGKEDGDVRKKIIEIVCPLPAKLREIIAIRLGEEGGDDTFAISLLKLYDHEQDEKVKAQASISYHTQLKASGQNTKESVDLLSQNIVCYGIDHDERRQAAFCGLVVLGSLDVMVNSKETVGEDKPCAISLGWRYSPNFPLLRLILQNWDYLKTVFDNDFWARLSKYTSRLLDHWDLFCSLADEYPSPRNEALQFLESQTERESTVNILRFLSRIRPQSKLLLEYCLKALRIENGGSDYTGEEAAVAAELLGTHFRADSAVLAYIMSHQASNEQIPENVIIALCEGWPDSKELTQTYEMIRKQERMLTYVTYFHLVCRKSLSAHVFKALIGILLRTEQLRSFSHDITRPILLRLQKDDNFSEMLEKHLENTPTSSEKASIPRLIGVSRGVSSELRTWCIGELNRQLNGKESPEVGFDLISCELRPVVHSLLDVLRQK